MFMSVCFRLVLPFPFFLLLVFSSGHQLGLVQRLRGSHREGHQTWYCLLSLPRRPQVLPAARVITLSTAFAGGEVVSSVDSLLDSPPSPSSSPSWERKDSP